MSASNSTSLGPPHESRYTQDENTGCWNWSGWITTNGYGILRLSDKRTALAHRFVFERTVGPVAEGLDLDHLCRNRRCVNPDHLEPVSRSENLRRGSRGKMTRTSIFQMRLLDATTSLTRMEIADLFCVSGRTVTRYLGSNGRGRHHEKFLRESAIGVEHRLATSCQRRPYPSLD